MDHLNDGRVPKIIDVDGIWYYQPLPDDRGNIHVDEDVTFEIDREGEEVGPITDKEPDSDHEINEIIPLKPFDDNYVKWVDAVVIEMPEGSIPRKGFNIYGLEYYNGRFMN